MQETRRRCENVVKTAHYVLIHSACTPQGHFGIAVGLHRSLPFACDEAGAPLFLTEQSYTVLATTPRLLIVKLELVDYKCLVIGAHAPHRGASREDIEAFWKDVSQAIPDRFSQWDRILLADANAGAGFLPNASIGDWQSSPFNDKDEPFAEFIAEQQLFLPATFQHLHQGEAGAWCHSSGKWSRLDYAGLPLLRPLTFCRSWINLRIDISTVKEDHRVACAEFEFPLEVQHGPRQPSRPRLQMDNIDWTAVSRLRTLQFPGDLNVRQHARQIQQHLVEAFATSRPEGPMPPRKTSMTRETWTLVQQKRSCRTHLHKLGRLQALHLMQSCLRGWNIESERGKALRAHRPLPDRLTMSQCTAIQAIQRDQDRLIATALSQFRRLGRTTTAALRKDDRAFFAGLLSQVGDFCSPFQAKLFWQKVRSALPRFRTRKLQLHPLKNEKLAQGWIPHFSALEVGTSITAQELLDGCLARQCCQASVQRDFLPADLPSVLDIEDVMRAVQPHRSTGLDPVPSGLAHRAPMVLADAFLALYHKIFMWQTEPISWKGGSLAPIPKKPRCAETARYRGILLLSTAAKRLHALLRQRLMTLLHHRRPAGQLGGYAQQEPAFGSQAVHTFHRIMTSAGLSSCIVFVDLSAAFHRLIRELIVGISVPQDLQAVLDSLAGSQADLAALGAILREPSMLEAIGAPPALKQLLADVHVDTWFQVQGNPVLVRTMRGTRPGSPLADCIFHAAMQSVAMELRQWISEQQDYQQLLRDFQLDVTSIIWADDLAVPWAVRDARQLVPAVVALHQKLSAIFHARGFDLNMDKGKTSVLLSFRGPSGPQLRQQYVLPHNATIAVPLESDRGVMHLPVVCHYKHLGTIVAANSSLDLEIRTRIGIASSTFKQLFRPLLGNRVLPLRMRIQLYKMLIETKLYYGLGAWPSLTVQQCQRLQATVLRFLQRVLRLTLEQRTQWTALRTFTTAGVLQPRARQAVDRLLYGQRMFAAAPEFLHGLIHSEKQQVENSWLGGLQADLRWFSALLPSVLPDDWAHDLTSLIEAWQGNALPWKSLVRRAAQLHCLQDEIAVEGLQRHKVFYEVLGDSGATFDPKPFAAEEHEDLKYPCHCGRRFSTGQGLSTHRRRCHAEYSLGETLSPRVPVPVVSSPMLVYPKASAASSIYLEAYRHQCMLPGS